LRGIYALWPSMHFMSKSTFTAAPLLAVALAASPLLAHSQAGSRPAGAPAAAPRTATGRVSGTVTDAANGKPVSYATVNIINPATNSPVNGGVAGDDGKFVLPVPAGTYRVEISFLGYTTQVKNGVTVTAGGGARASHRRGGAAPGLAVRQQRASGQGHRQQGGGGKSRLAHKMH